VLQWSGVKWSSEGGEHRPETAAYMCESCGSLWNDGKRHAAVRGGTWRATKPFTGIAGFHIPAFISPWVNLTDCVREFLASKGNPELFKIFVNTVLGECWEEAAESIDETSFVGRREAYGPQDLPDDIQLITAGVDCHADRLEIQTMGWGAHEESWVIDYHVIYGDPAQRDVWRNLDAILADSFRTVAGRTLHIYAVCVDSGGHWAQQVLEYCKTRRRRRVFAIKGAAGVRPIWPKWGSRTKDNNIVFSVGVDVAKETIYARLRIPMTQQDAPIVHFPIGDKFNDAYFKQLASEEVATRYREGRPYRVWLLRSGRRNEVLDTTVYCLAARMSVTVNMQRLARPAAAPLPAAVPAVPQSTPTPTQAPRKRSIASMLAR
jgi:phage terminase large subunit GpA-like protein